MKYRARVLFGGLFRPFELGSLPWWDSVEKRGIWFDRVNSGTPFIRWATLKTLKENRARRKAGQAR